METILEIYFSDLNEEAKKAVLKLYSLTKPEENWDITPLFVLTK